MPLYMPSHYPVDHNAHHIFHTGNIEPSGWFENKPFYAILIFDRFLPTPNRIAVWREPEGDGIYYMFMQDMADLIKHGEIKGGRTENLFYFRQTGENFGLARYKQEKKYVVRPVP